MRRIGKLPLLSLCLLASCSDDGARPAPSDGGGGREAASHVDAAREAEARPPPDAAPPEPPEAAPPPPPLEAAIRDAEAAVEEEAALPPGADYPRLLSQTGLFKDIRTETLGDGVRTFQPRYVLWSDGATKRRWLYLPEGAQIDTSDMDFWRYPVGTTAWKEFTRDGTRVETRMLRKKGPNVGDWTMIAYRWNGSLTDAIAVPEGVPNARGTAHDIPSQANCQFCHGNMQDVLLGVTAIQLSHSAALDGLRIDDLIGEGRLTDPPAAPIQIPGDAVAEQALGYLHANCGICHNSRSSVARTTPLRLWELTGRLDSVEGTLGYETTVGRPNNFLPALHVIEPGLPDDSELVIRISERGARQMPPLATKIVDPTGIAKIRAWVESLPRPREAGAPDAAPHDAGPAPGDAGPG